MITFSSRSTVAAATQPKRTPAQEKQHYFDLLRKAKRPEQTQHMDGNLVAVKNPVTGAVQITGNGLMGFYGIVYNGDGSVTQCVPPAVAPGGRRQVLPPGTFQMAELEQILAEK